MHPDLERLFDLSGRVTIVTGGSRGLGRAVALGRNGEPDELVGPALLLASDAGSFLTGVVLTVDAGATC